MCAKHKGDISFDINLCLQRVYSSGWECRQVKQITLGRCYLSYLRHGATEQAETNFTSARTGDGSSQTGLHRVGDIGTDRIEERAIQNRRFFLE